jgi:hypothetical protein
MLLYVSTPTTEAEEKEERREKRVGGNLQRR